MQSMSRKMDSRVSATKMDSSVNVNPKPSKGSSMKDLPLDLVNEIITQAAPCLTTLDTCKMICKDWNELLNSPDFMPNYCKKTKNVYGFILQGDSRWGQEFVSLEKTQIDSLGRSMMMNPSVRRQFASSDYDVKTLASSKHGLVLAVGVNSTWREKMLYIGKPMTQHWMNLPLPDFGRYKSTLTAALVVMMKKTLNSGSNPYKIIRLSHERRVQYVHCEVFDSRTWDWKTVESMKVNLDDSAGQPVTLGNLVHWLTTDNHVLTFNCEDDSHYQFPLPEIGLKLNKNDIRTLVEYEGKLGLMYMRKEEGITRVWARSGGIWTMVKEFNLDECLKSEEARPVGLYNRDIVILAAPRKIIFYNQKDSSILRCLKTESDEVALKNIFQFRSDFEEVDLLRSGDD